MLAREVVVIEVVARRIVNSTDIDDSNARIVDVAGRRIAALDGAIMK
jgi:hypothetical protein